jgi:enoyl-CoA hydratase/carnithine racemase
MADPNDPERSTPMEEDGIRYENAAAGVARVVLARPEARNAQDKAMLYALNSAFDRAAHDDAIKVIVLSADGPHFSSGHDLRDQSKIADFEPVGNWGGALSAEEARALGMVNSVVAREDLESYTLNLAERIASRPSMGLKLAKQSVNQMQDAQGLWPALQAAMSLQQLGHSHSQQVFNLPVDPSGVGIIRKQAKGDT